MFKLIKDLATLSDAAEDIYEEKNGLGFDTETYGTGFNDRMFSMQISTENHTYYFNFHSYGDSTPVMNKQKVFATLAPAMSDTELWWYIHNAKFDLRRLAIEGASLKGGVHCTQMNERFIYNQHMRYSLDACLQRRGMKKDDAVLAYINEHKLWTMVDGEKRKHYEKVPFDIVFEYGCIDAEKVRILGIDQRKNLEQHAFYHNDLELEKVAYAMEEKGIAVRTEYAESGRVYEREAQQECADQLSRLAGEPFKSGPKWLRGIFDKHNVPYRVNPKTNNPKFDKTELDKIDHPIAGLIRKYRKHEKYASTYYDCYSKTDLIHAEIKLFGTDTGRFSYAEPNLQNVPKEEELEEDIPYQVRGCFVPRTEDHCFVMIDFNQQEFRLLLDYAGEHELIARINDFGEDVHQATADLVGVTRKQAKTINFGLLYGMGSDKLAASLKLTRKEADEIKSQYFGKLPKVKRLIRAIIDKAERVGHIETWCGRRLYVPAPWRDPDTGAMVRFEYVMPNHLIQGGCGDIARFAMPECDRILREGTRNSAMLVQVHDELLFEIHKDELSIVPSLIMAMENTYKPFNKMKLTCGVDHSWVSWGKRDVVAGLPVL